MTHFLVDLANNNVHRCLLGNLVQQVKEHCQGFLRFVHCHQNSRFLVLVERVGRVELLGLLEALEGVPRQDRVVLGHSQVSVQHSRLLVDLNSLGEELSSLVELLLLEADVSKTPPSVVVALVGRQGSLVALLRRVEVLVRHVLVPAQSVSVRKAVIELDGSVEELESGLVFFLERVAVAHHAPRLWREQ